MYKNNKRKYTGKSRTYTKKGYGGTIRRSQKGYVRREGNYGRYRKDGELKYLDGTFDKTDIDIGGDINASINLIPQGTTQSERIGRKVVIKKIILKYKIILNESDSSTTTNDYLRWIVYQDKQCNGATATAANILALIGGHGVLSNRNLTESGRFIILKDIKTAITSEASIYQEVATNLVNMEKEKWEEHYIECNIPVEFDSTTGAITEIRSNNIGYLLISANGLLDVISTFRIRYTDN